ncbi:MFS transporter [Janthinobacterium fluminis]|uniref:MFS transporter n=1 Tax=Janthinobacterium fluminis TaxID=2987524 RepID=A0ABT5K1J6_9BURK|nr:MFS transporter [Janthinobacterium fluminis]MDC8758305.1 MFS transporter [Janthinobacterium fluminis]
MKQLQMRLVLLATLGLLLSALLLSWLTLRDFERDLPPEMARTVAAVSYSSSEVLGLAYQYGVPFKEMVGVDEFLDAVRKDNPSIAYMLVTDLQGKVLYQSGYADLPEKKQLQRLFNAAGTSMQTTTRAGYFNTDVPLVFQRQRLGSLHLGQRSALVEQKLQEISYDVITVLVVAVLIALELMRFVLTFTVAAPADVTRAFLSRVRQGDFSHYLPHDRLAGIGQLSAPFNAIVAELNRRFQALCHLPADAAFKARLQQRLAPFQFHAAGQRPSLLTAAVDYIRWPFFLLIFADSLSLSFFPFFVDQFYSAEMGISKNLVIGLPISLFMLTWALSMPWAGMWCDRVGHRTAFIVGAGITTLGLALTACAQTLYDLLLWRSLTALGYGLVFITAQSYISNNTPPAQRTKGMAIFLSSFFAGSLSGSAIGGILADRLGYHWTILLSALLSLISAIFVFRFLHKHLSLLGAPKKRLSFHDFKLLLKNKKFSAITFLAAIPAKIALTGFLYYAVPLYLKLLGNNQSTTGRIMMAYGLAIIILSPLVAKLADKIGQLRWFVTIGGYGAATAMVIIYLFDNTFGLLLSISLLGIAHAIGVSPQLALVNDFCKDVVQEVGVGTATGIFRLIERIGNVLGPIVAGLLISHFNFKGAFLGIGILCFICVSCFTAIFFWYERPPSPAALHVA